MRKEVTDAEISIGLKEVGYKLNRRLEEKGRHGYITSHEVLGIITEEYWELVDAVHKNDLTGILKECLDIAVAGLFAYISILFKKIEW